MDSGFQKRTFGPGLAIGPVVLWAMERLAPQVMSQKGLKPSMSNSRQHAIPSWQLSQVLSSIKGAWEARAAVLTFGDKRSSFPFPEASISADKLFIPGGLHDFIAAWQCLS